MADSKTPQKGGKKPVGKKPVARKTGAKADKAAAPARDKNRVVPSPSLPMYNDGMLNTAIKAAREAARIQMRAFRHAKSLEITSKSSGDFFTQIDRQSEETIVEILSQAYPDHRFLGEEYGNKGNPDSEYCWVIDPLDGTTNFIHGIDQFAVSIACMKGKSLQHAVVYDVTRNELFTASRGKGAFLDGKRIRVSGQTILRNSLIAVGFPFREGDNFERFLNISREMMPRTSGLRRAGSAALDLCWTSCGRFDAYWEYGIKPWDIAAGALIAMEAGALVTDFNGDGNYMDTCEIIASTPKLFPELLNMIQKNK